MKTTLAALAVGIMVSCSPQKPSVLPEVKDNYTKNDLAQCLVDNDVKIYGAWWCPPCHYQKSLFGMEAWKIMEKNHVECYEQGSFDKKPACQAAEIDNVPTWVLPSGRKSGVLTLEQLSEFSGCPYGQR